jgi:hypothetical protein
MLQFIFSTPGFRSFIVFMIPQKFQIFTLIFTVIKFSGKYLHF